MSGDLLQGEELIKKAQDLAVAQEWKRGDDLTKMTQICSAVRAAYNECEGFDGEPTRPAHLAQIGLRVWAMQRTKL